MLKDASPPSCAGSGRARGAGLRSWCGTGGRSRPPVPSSQNWQPWDFILITDHGQLRELARVWRGAGHVAGSAAAIVVIGPAADNEFGPARFDPGQATMTMMLAAADLGIGSCHAGGADLQLAREVLGFPENRDWALIISLGYPAGRPLAPIRVPARRPLAEVVHRGRW